MESIDVRLRSGVLRGAHAGHRAAFRNVPYAAPPFGPNRFLPPQPVPAWDGVRDASGPTTGVPQPRLPGDELGPALYCAVEDGDDCLVLEVHTPDVGAGGLPVMVWIHGGGFMTGSAGGPLHDGGTFAREGIVHVAINYRLHVDGFLYLGPGTANLGLLDQVAALEWVQENIAAFGGDPGNVTIYGQSAGALSVLHLLTMARAQGLFRRAISQSGSTEGAMDLETAERFTKHMAELLGVPATAAGLASVSRERLLQGVLVFGLEYASPALWGADTFMISPFRPVLDGEVLVQAPVPAAAAGVGADIDLLAGTTRDECTFTMAPVGLLSELNEPWAAMALDAFGLTWDDLESYRKASRPHADRPELLMAAWTDWAFRIPTLRLAEARARAGHAHPTWVYEFTWPSPLGEFGSAHSLDMAFIMDRLDVQPTLPAELDFLGRDAPQSIANTMHGAWASFASTGDPGWAPYDLDRRPTMRFDVDGGLVDDLAGPVERELWDGRR
jgi:para-nitrobenzyl esterase